MKRIFNYTIFSWAKFIYGPVFLSAGAFVLYQFVIEITHAFGNGSLLAYAEGLELAFVLTLWLFFFVLGLSMLIFGIWILESDRNSWVEGKFLHTSRGLIPVFHKKYSSEEIKSFEIVKKAAFMVVPIIGTNVYKSYKTGFRFHLEAVLEIRRISLARFKTEEEAIAAKKSFEIVFSG